MITSIDVESIIDINNNHQSSSNLSKRNSAFSTETDRHISFNDKYDEKQERQKHTSTHIDFIHASESEILNRYLSCFEQQLSSFINKKFENSEKQIDIEQLKLSNSPIHHKDDIELHHLRRIQIAFESIEQDDKPCIKDDIIIIIDAFHIFIENILKKNLFIAQCQTKQQQNNDHEISALIHINHGDIFHRILISFNRICHSPLNKLKPSKIAERLTILFHNLFINMDDHCSLKLVPLLIENYHRFTFSIENKSISLFSTIQNLPKNLDRAYFLALDILMKSIEQSTDKSPYNIKSSHCGFMCDSAKRLLATILYQIRTSNNNQYSITNTNDCIQAFRAILKKIFTSSSLSSMIKIVEDKEICIDFKIEERYFQIVIVFFKHLYRMNKRCTNEYERNLIMDYFATILFGDLHRKGIPRKMKQIFQLFIQHFDQIKWRK